MISFINFELSLFFFLNKVDIEYGVKCMWSLYFLWQSLKENVSSVFCYNTPSIHAYWTWNLIMHTMMEMPMGALELLVHVLTVLMKNQLEKVDSNHHLTLLWIRQARWFGYHIQTYECRFMYSFETELWLSFWSRIHFMMSEVSND